MSKQISLTEEQQAVVMHTEGPALVFAVAGAGKTTAMVHRIARMVAAGRIQPRRILATSFGRTNVQDLKKALRPFPNTQKIDVRTLHSLGRDIIRQGQQLGVGAHLKLNGHGHGQSNPSHRLLTTALSEARRQNVLYKAELDGLDRQDFLDYVDQCKGNLQYAHLADAALPAQGAQAATQASDPSPQLTWYLDLYRLYEKIRLQQGIVTFSDMLLTGWEILVRYPEVLTAVQCRYDHILVDEFQDVNLAQSEMLELLSQPHRNYVAIGDDDQTIYEWRGASPRYILAFPKRYDAKTYLMRDNFRCPAIPLVLANRVIAHNSQRFEKQLQLTQGFQGETAVLSHRNIDDMSQDIVQRVQALHKKGEPLNEMAVLVRLNAQTPPIEQALITAHIPYRVSQPFYERLEIKTLIQYGRLAWFEGEVQAGKRPLMATTSRELMAEAWRDVSNRPKRYMSADSRRRIWEEARQQARPLSQIIRAEAKRVNYGWQAEPLEKLADDLSWLAKQLSKPAYKVLHQLDIRLDYQPWLKTSSGFRQTGEGRAISVSTFINYARKQNNDLTHFLLHIRQLAQNKIGKDSSPGGDMLTVSTIHQAKGLEWSVVFIPQCSQGYLPFISERAGDKAQVQEMLAEERRLFYVALTRTKRDCYLHLVKGEKRSQFLEEGGYQAVLTDLPKLALLITTPPNTWQAADVYLLVQAVDQYGLQRFFDVWWPVPEAQKIQIGQRLWQFITAVQQHDLLSKLDITPDQLAFWQAVLPPKSAANPSPFPGLKKLLRSKQAQNRSGRQVAAARRSETERHVAIPEPDTILPGMWVLSDAGWGRIEKIMDLLKRPLASIERSNTYSRLAVTLRPGHDAEPVEIDVSAAKIRFQSGRTLYICARCEQFVSSQTALIIKDHNSRAHDDLSPGFKQVKGSAIPLKTLRFATQPDLDPTSP